MNKHVMQAALTELMVPYVGIPAWTGTIRGEGLRYEQQREISDRRRILLGRAGGSYYMGMEEHLPGAIARQMPAEYEPETLKVQAIIAGTCICRQTEGAGDEEEIVESALDMDYPEADQLKKPWGSSRFSEYYKKLEDAVKATSSIVMTYEGKCVDPTYYRATAGMTRRGDSIHFYLRTVNCPGDMETGGYMQILPFSRESFVSDINSISVGESGPRTVEASQAPDTIWIISRNDARYADIIQIGSVDYTGEEVQYALNLVPLCLMLEPYEDEIRVVVKGIGHGYGLGQATANEKAKGGWKVEDILEYFYKNIASISKQVALAW